jgi:hypothetical protein
MATLGAERRPHTLDGCAAGGMSSAASGSDLIRGSTQLFEMPGFRVAPREVPPRCCALFATAGVGSAVGSRVAGAATRAGAAH